MNFPLDPQPFSEQRIVQLFVDGTGFSIKGFSADEPSSLATAIRDFYKDHGLPEPKITAALEERKLRVVAGASAGPDTSTRAGHRRDRRNPKQDRDLAAMRAHNGHYVTWTLSQRHN